MHWERLISEKKVKFYVLPMIPIIFLWGTLLFSQDTNFNILVIIGLLWCLAFEMFFIETLEQWFIKIRLIVTFFALIPLFLIFLLFRINDIEAFFYFFLEFNIFLVILYLRSMGR